MRNPAPQESKTAPLLHLFNRNKASTVKFEDDILTVWAKSGRIAQSVNADQIKEVQLQRQTLVNQLTILTKQGRTISVNGLDRSSSTALHSQLSNRVEEILNDEAVRTAVPLGPEIKSLRDSMSASLTPDRYFRSSHAAAMTQSVEKLYRQLDDRAQSKLDNNASRALRWLETKTEPAAETYQCRATKPSNEQPTAANYLRPSRAAGPRLPKKPRRANPKRLSLLHFSSGQKSTSFSVWIN